MGRPEITTTFLLILLIGEMNIFIARSISDPDRILLLSEETTKRREVPELNLGPTSPPPHRSGCHKKPWSPKYFSSVKKKKPLPPPPAGLCHALGGKPQPHPHRVHKWGRPTPPRK
ncbi:hypothetical protein ACP275_07G046900 [Erythranthe tilingii]